MQYRYNGSTKRRYWPLCRVRKSAAWPLWGTAVSAYTLKVRSKHLGSIKKRLAWSLFRSSAYRVPPLWRQPPRPRCSHYDRNEGPQNGGTEPGVSKLECPCWSIPIDSIRRRQRRSSGLTLSNSHYMRLPGQRCRISLLKVQKRQTFE